ncbi:palmitoyltransferase PFA3 [Plectosphaerella cucumerina]|uniref:Palmitoyltransferase n=1 Tax=Plectosphaerella cucumerina TaxID=40658 RepID=A0A8K0TTA0_9PEZI|nr:palmitoyltransferase PFA3 [Plectosphaerella cucumerina]
MGRWARRAERCCCTFATYLPLSFVYGLTTWAVWVDVRIGSSQADKPTWLGHTSSAGALLIYALLNWSYTTAVFTDPGGTTNRNGYAELPTDAPPAATSFTVKSNGEMRFCKKCQAKKPDRAHHCSSCKRCVLKMDHHCPWLATCIGLRNHKAFLLFLIYTTLLCFYSFAVSATWVYREILNNTKYVENLLPVNFIILSVVSGIIGVVVGAFTGWHILLASRGQTTIECLEKTRYLSPIRKLQNAGHIHGVPIPHYGQQLIDAHAHALPGITSPEEGEEMRDRDHHRPSAASGAGTALGLDGQRPAQLSFDEMERQRARKRYEDYLDEQDSEKLPNAFDLGWRRNLLHLLGPTPLLWPLPICNTTGNGWAWEASPRWVAASERIRAEREEQRRREINAGWGSDDAPPQFRAPSPPSGAGRHYLNRPSPSPGRRVPSKADRILGRDPNLYADQSPDAVSLRRLSPRGRTLLDEDLDTDGDDDDDFTDDRAELLSQDPMRGDTDAKTAAEHRAMNLVTNGGWGRGGASGLLRKHSGSPSTAGPPSPHDDTVD